MSASRCWIVGNSASARPVRVRARRGVRRPRRVAAAWAMPTFTAASPARNVGATTPNTRSPPAPGAPMRAASSTSTSSRTIATLELPAMPRPSHAPSKLHARRVALDRVAVEALAVGALDEHEQDVGVAAGGHEALAAADRDAPLRRSAPQLGAVEVRAGAALAERERAERLAGGHPGQQLRRPVAAAAGDRRRRDGVHEEHHAGRRARRRRRPRTPRRARCQAAARSAVLGRHEQAERAGVRQRPDVVVREAAAAVDLGRRRRDLRLGDLAHRAQHCGYRPHRANSLSGRHEQARAPHMDTSDDRAHVGTGRMPARSRCSARIHGRRLDPAAPDTMRL